MFVQVIQGRVSDERETHAALDSWMHELAPGSIGWLGTTAGVTDEGRFIALARFESQDAARRNSDRREQDQWWTQTSKLFTEEPTFKDSESVAVDMVGEPDEAGFVQIIQGRTTDPARAKELMSQDASDWAAFRPEIIGSVSVDHAGGAYTMALYFTSEEAAREGERKELPAELKAQMEAMDALSAGAPEFFDLKRPWLYSAAAVQG
jgi:hypothetical protein